MRNTDRVREPGMAGLAGNINALKTGARSRRLAPIYRALPPRTRVFLQQTIQIASAEALASIPRGSPWLVKRERRRARLRALYAVMQLLAAIDVSTTETTAAVHLAAVRAMAPVFLDPAFLRREPPASPAEWPPFVDDGS